MSRAKKSAAPAAPEQQHHYFASTAFNWATAPTRAEAIANVARAAGKDAIQRNVKAHGGLYCWSCRVDAPQSATYTIDNYAPSLLTTKNEDGKFVAGAPVPKRDGMNVRIQNIRGHVIIEEADKE